MFETPEGLIYPYFPPWFSCFGSIMDCKAWGRNMQKNTVETSTNIALSLQSLTFWPPSFWGETVRDCCSSILGDDHTCIPYEWLNDRHTCYEGLDTIHIPSTLQRVSLDHGNRYWFLWWRELPSILVMYLGVEKISSCKIALCCSCQWFVFLVLSAPHLPKSKEYQMYCVSRASGQRTLTKVVNFLFQFQ